MPLVQIIILINQRSADSSVHLVPSLIKIFGYYLKLVYIYTDKSAQCTDKSAQCTDKSAQCTDKSVPCARLIYCNFAGSIGIGN